MIEGVLIRSLKRIPDERGMIMQMLRNDDPDFDRFGEIYFSMIYPGVIKAWHGHRAMTLNYACVWGMIKLVLYDAREGSSTKGEIQEIFMGARNYIRVTIPPEVLNGFKGISDGPALVANCSTIPHDPNEIYRIDPLENDIPYDWARKNG